jgi:hypothetical protein
MDLEFFEREPIHMILELFRHALNFLRGRWRAVWAREFGGFSPGEFLDAEKEDIAVAGMRHGILQTANSCQHAPQIFGRNHSSGQTHNGTNFFAGTPDLMKGFRRCRRIFHPRSMRANDRCVLTERAEHNLTWDSGLRGLHNTHPCRKGHDSFSAGG